MYKNVLLVGINSKYIHTNLAIRYLQKYVQEYSDGINIRIYESTINNQIYEIIQDIFLKKPEVVFFSVYIWNYEVVEKVAKTLKKIVPNLIIGYGGPEISWKSQEVLKNDYVDIIISGEGERALLNYLTQPIKDVKSIYYKEDENIVFNGIERSIDNLDEIPFSYDLDKIEESKILYYESTRGCPFNCSYCISSLDKKIRYFSLDRVKNDLKKFIDNKVKLVKFVDRTYNINKERYREIWRYLIENYNGITTFHFEIKIDNLDNQDFDILNNAPNDYFQFEIGIQTINEETLDEINRKNDLEKIKNNVSKISDNIHIHLDLIAGLPYESYEIFKKSFNYVYNLKPEMLQLGFLKLLSGTQIREEKDKHSYEFLGFPPYEVLKNRYISYDDILKLKNIEKILDIYYNSNNFKYTINYINGKFENPFEFYEKFSMFWDERDYFKVSHKKYKYFNYLYEFLIENGFSDKIIKNYLKVDYFLLGKTGFYPYWLNSKKDKDRYKSILLTMNFNSRREANKKTDYEILDYDIFNNEMENIELLFIYGKKNKLKVFKYEN